ncbi:MAG: NADPH-dependent FMN reductase [Leptospirales bacterium]
MISILAISGSLRRASQNTTVLRAASRLAPGDCTITLCPGLGDLPLFNPDLEGTETPSVDAFRTRIREADGILIASPEYAHGVSGVLKNALDWVVGSGEFVGKPVAILNASIQATYAYASLGEILSVMDATLLSKASITLPLNSNRIDEERICSTPELSGLLSRALFDLCDSIRQIRQNRPDS